FPQAITVIELGEPATLRVPEKTVKGAQRHVFLVRRVSSKTTQMLPRQRHDPRKVPFPELLRSQRVSGLEPIDPVRNRSRGRHGAASLVLTLGKSASTKSAVRAPNKLASRYAA